MRISLVLVALAVAAMAVALVLPPVSAPEATADENTIGLWHMNEGSGTTVSDSSGKGNSGTIYGSVTWVGGVYNMGLKFPGGTTNTYENYVSVPHSESLAPTGGLSELSVEVWVFPDPGDSSFPSGWGGGVIGKFSWEGDDMDNGWFIKLENSSEGGYENLDLVIAYSSGQNAYRGVKFNDVIPVKRWTHIAFVYNTTWSPREKVYVNGTQKTVSNAWKDTAGDNIKSSTENLFIGCEHGSQTFFKGRIDEVRIENRALTPSEVEQDAQSAGGVTITVTVTGTVGITISPTTYDYGLMNLGENKTTYSNGHTFTVQNTGDAAEDFSIKGSDASDGHGHTWTLGSSPASDTYQHQYTDFATSQSAAPGNYNNLTTSATAASGESKSVPIGGYRYFSLNLWTPTSSTETEYQYSFPVTVSAAWS